MDRPKQLGQIANRIAFPIADESIIDQRPKLPQFTVSDKAIDRLAALTIQLLGGD